MKLSIRPVPRGNHRLILLWATLSVVALLANALWRLAPIALAPFHDGSADLPILLAYTAWAVFMAYSEGYRAFHLRFSPRVVARAYYLGEYPSAPRVILALPFCMSLFYAARRQRTISWILLLAIIVVVLAVRQLPQPWRGVIDGGVVIGLGIGAISILYYLIRALSGHVPSDAALPPGHEPTAIAAHNKLDS